MSTEVIVALILTAGTIIVGGIAAFADLRNSIGKSNGNGSLIEMCERLLAGQADQDGRLATLEAGQSNQAGRLESVETRLHAVETVVNTETQRNIDRDEAADRKAM